MAELNLGRVVGPPGKGLPAGGAVGQVPVKLSADDYDIGWEEVMTKEQAQKAINAAITRAMEASY